MSQLTYSLPTNSPKSIYIIENNIIEKKDILNLLKKNYTKEYRDKNSIYYRFYFHKKGLPLLKEPSFHSFLLFQLKKINYIF